MLHTFAHLTTNDHLAIVDSPHQSEDAKLLSRNALLDLEVETKYEIQEIVNTLSSRPK
jgi:hypothetical protein